MRLLFRKRIDDVARKGDRLPKEFNFLHIAEQAMEVEFSDNSRVTVALFLFMAVFLVVSSFINVLSLSMDMCAHCSDYPYSYS